MVVCDKWVVLKICEFVACVACLVAKRVSDDDSQRLELLMQKLSREWSLLRSVTWDALGSSFGDALYGGYVLITFGLLLGRMFRELPRGRRVLEGFLLGVGLLLFLIIGGLELASLDSIPHNLIVNAAVLGTLSLLVAALFLVDLMGPRVITASRPAQTDTPFVAQPARVAPTLPASNGLTNGAPGEKLKDTIVPIEKPKETSKDTTDGEAKMEKKKEESVLFERPQHGYTKFADDWDKDELGKSKYGSHRDGDERFEGGNYVRLSDPQAERDRLHYERELDKFNETYFRGYLDAESPPVPVRQEYLPELQTPSFSKVKSGRLRSIYDELSPAYRSKSPPRQRGATPTLQQLEEYLRGAPQQRRPRADTPSAVTALFPMEPIEEARGSLEERASATPTDPGYVQYAADRWPDSRHSRHSSRTPRHSPTE